MWYDPILSYKSKLKINIISKMYGEKIPHSTCKVAIYVSHDLVHFMWSNRPLHTNNNSRDLIKKKKKNHVYSADVEYTLRWWTNLTMSAVIGQFPCSCLRSCELSSASLIMQLPLLFKYKSIYIYNFFIYEKTLTYIIGANTKIIKIIQRKIE